MTYAFICTNTWCARWRKSWLANTNMLSSDRTALIDMLTPCVQVDLRHLMTCNTWVSIVKNTPTLITKIMNLNLNYAYKKLLGKSKAARCISPGTSKFSQTSFAIVVFLNSVNCASLNLTTGSAFSYLN